MSGHGNLRLLAAAVSLALCAGMPFAGCNNSDPATTAFLSAPAVVFPSDGTAGLETSSPLRWEDPLPRPAVAAAYDLEIAADASFATVVERATGLAGTEYRPQLLVSGAHYYWRVRARAGGARSPWSFTRSFETAPAGIVVPERPVIYQLVPRHFGNTTGQNVPDGDIATNGCGRFADIDDTALRRIAEMGVTHVWLTGVLQQATLTDYAAYGEPASDPDIVKGRAGSFYAVRDYYDVSPDYATDPAQRMDEFRALVDRVHAAGLRVLIDFVPNHVARDYASTNLPAGEPDLGASDDQGIFFARDNAYFYLQANPGRALDLPIPATWNPPGQDGRFAREDGTAGRTARVTGNNETLYDPPLSSWYETVKLDYGYDFTTGSSDYGTPADRPATWLRTRRILEFWVDQGVDGFRCDFAHYVPNEAWSFLIGETRAHAAAAGRNLFFLAEAYADLSGLLAAGFDAVYDDGTYDRLKTIYQASGTVAGLDAYLQTFTDADRGRWARYLENHDERRIASPIVPGGSADDSGFGSMEAGRHLAPLAYLAGNGPVLVYNGQEVGEAGAGAEGYGGDDGRTTIFDYWRVPALSAWVNGHAYDGGGLTAQQASLRLFYRRVLSLAAHPYARGDRYYGLDFVNAWAQDSLIFARYATGGRGLLVVATNFQLAQVSGSLRVPYEVGDAGNANLPADVTVTRILSPYGGDATLTTYTTRTDLDATGFPVILPGGSSAVYLIR